MRWGPSAFDTGVGSQTIILPGDVIDLHTFRQVEGVLKVTKADTDAADSLDALLQFTRDNSFWYTVGRWGKEDGTLITGDMSPSATAPEFRHILVTNRIAVDPPEEAFEPTSSTGASEIPIGSVKNVSFPEKVYYNSAWVAAFRIKLVVTDADNDADFEGSVTLWFS